MVPSVLRVGFICTSPHISLYGSSDFNSKLLKFLWSNCKTSFMLIISLIESGLYSLKAVTNFKVDALLC
jgi:hypothetical protein